MHRRRSSKTTLIGPSIICIGPVSFVPTGNGAIAYAVIFMKSVKAPWGKTDRADGRHYLTLGFYSQDSGETDQSALVNRVVQCYTGRGRHPALCFVHVELRFSDNVAFSITNAGIHLEQRVLSKPNYSTFFRLAVSKEQEERMRRKATQLYEQKAQFNWLGLIWNFLPFTSCCQIKPVNSFICTELVLIVLQSGSLFENVDASRTSPNDLYDLCIKSESGARLSYNKMV